MHSSRRQGMLLSTAVVAALCGAWVCGTLLAQHDGGWRSVPDGGGWFAGLCGSSGPSSLSCREVVESRWGSFDFTIGGTRHVVPASFAGLAYFVAAAIWLAVLGRQGTRSRLLRWATGAASCAGLAASILLISVMVFSLGAWCPQCVAGHVCNVLMLAATWAGLRQGHSFDAVFSSMAERAGDAYVNRLGWIATCGVALSTTGLWFYYDAARELRRQWRKVDACQRAMAEVRENSDMWVREFHAQSVREIPLRSTASASSGIVIFSNPGCRGCACFEKFWRHVAADMLPANVLIERRLARSSGASDSGSVAADSGRTGDDEARRVEEDAALARSLGVTTVPAVFVGGRRVPDLCLNSWAFWNTIAAELSQQVAASDATCTVEGFSSNRTEATP